MKRKKHWTDEALEFLLKKVGDQGWDILGIGQSPCSRSRYVTVQTEKGYVFYVRVSDHLRKGRKRWKNAGCQVNVMSKYGAEKAVKYMIKSERWGLKPEELGEEAM